MILSLLSLSSLPSLACMPAAQDWSLHHPQALQEAYPDTVFWLTDQRPLRSWALIDDSGAQLPLVEHRIGTLRGLYPDARLEPGTYQLVADEHGLIPAVVELQVLEGAEPVARVPGAQRRSRYSEYTFEEHIGACTPDIPQTGVSYVVCGEHAVTLFAVGPDEPPSPLDEPDGVQVSGAVSIGLEPGNAARVWIGGFDGAGRFTGWIPDDVDLPLSGSWIRETNDTDSPEDCPEPGSWVLEETEGAGNFTVAGTHTLSGDPRDPRAPGDELDEPAAPVQEGAGCSTAPAVASSLSLWILLGLRRRSRSSG